ncbi:hypothetical protein F3Y22_tig00117005pilonHSYRG00401 [Hibiscus syriacus]|uniref:RNase H type-1 domain-containing protein n=1 Tax=Hibiscus syriacus TaxID=106335 RepID=A0A6A2WDB3_HIBSY|nr:hypothetical protein F3Y22_tig00117005pilonHSYRG00401 [Hibiscus syriacus]
MLYATVDLFHATVIDNVLKEFGYYSGHKVNKRKSHVYFSLNTPADVRNSICSTLGIQEVESFDTYLGAPMFMGRVGAAHFNFIINKFHGKLNGWTAHTLSLAGRITLAKSILSILPIYFMQVADFPLKVCAEIERHIRRFIWGSSTDNTKVSLVRWDVVCQPLDQDGLDILFPLVQNKPTLTSLLEWSVGNGSVVRFWEDNWIPSLGHLCNPALVASHGHDNLNFHNFLIASRQWNEEALAQCLPPHALRHIINVQPLIALILVTFPFGHGRTSTHMEQQSHWSTLPSGWMCLNTDDAVSTTNQTSSIGGVIRDPTGAWVTGFYKNIGVSSVLQAELWSIHEGLLIAWDSGISKLIVQSDSKQAIKMLTAYDRDLNPLSLVRTISVLSKRAWNISFKWIPRDCNKAADYLAKLAPPHCFNLTVVDSPPWKLYRCAPWMLA